MSNKSYSIKENSHVIVNQGGEKKVMKKILSVALSTAMAFSMFATVAFGADAKLTPEQQFNTLKEAGIVEGFPDGLSHLDRSLTRAELAKIIVKATDLTPVDATSYNDKNYAKHWARTYIEAVTQANIMEGKNLEKKLFDPSGNLSVQELAAVLVRALKLEVPTETNNTATEWAKGYVEAAVKGGYIDAGINYQANASRSQAIVAAYAIYEAAQVPTVASYTVSEAGKVVEFTLSNKEVVKVTLEKALEPNKETEVKFTHNGHDYTHKVTYVTTVAQKVDSVKAENLKEVIVTFDGTVDSATAGNESNYTIQGKSIDSATVSDDKTSVTLLLADDANSVLVNQKQTTISLKNIKNEDGTKTFTQDVQFTPIDVTAPTVKEVVGLGTSAIKVKFSEPVKESVAIASVNYRIDGKVIGASVKYAYPDTVIVVTPITEGEHVLRVSGVTDFSGLSVAPVENKFTTVVDTAAPEIKEIKSSDLTKVTVTFDETIKSVSDAYANNSSKTASKIVINDNKVTLFFDGDTKRLNQGENTIVLKGVSDYSGNKADREGKVTPELDTVRPVVTNVDFHKDGADYVAELQFSKSLKPDVAKKADNYKLVDSDGKVAKIAGVDNSGHPIRGIKYDDRTKKVEINFGPVFDKEYTLEVSGVRDNAYIGNEIIPASFKLNPAGTENGKISRVWVEDASRGQYVYVEFNTPVVMSGAGSALDPAKYSIAKKGTTNKVALTKSADDIDPVTSSSVRIYVDSKNLTVGTDDTLYVDYIANLDGKYLTEGTGYTLSSVVKLKNDAVKTTSVEATANDSLTVKFDTALNNVDVNEFSVKGTATNSTYKTSYPNDYSLSADGKTLTLKFSDDKLPVEFSNTSLKLVAAGGDDARTRDVYGNPVKVDFEVANKIAPEVIAKSFDVAPPVGTKYTASFDVTKIITDKAENFTKSLFSVEVTPALGGDKKKTEITEVKANGTKLEVIFTVEGGINTGDYVKVSLDNNSGAIVDGNGNSLKTFNQTKIYNQ
ncbi:hypothetical protein [Paenibacillus motobuensis]|uniref:SLH domain-containing protein n=1 Tax=Paenibacillus motobuensis TaxID=295324 RepID=A0ABN0YSB4_9BACL